MGRKSDQKNSHIKRELESKQDSESRYERYQLAVFCFLEQPKNNIAIAYHLVNVVFIVLSIIVSVLSTIKSYETNDTFNLFTFVFEIVLLAWFSVEYLLRAWSCSVLKRFRGCSGRLKFLKNFYMCVDAFIIVSTTVTSLMQVERSYFTILRAMRFLQVFRILRLDRQKGDLKIMLQVVRIHHRELLTCYFASFIILFGGAYFVYILEHDANGSTITNMVNGMYWGFVTVTSVGYGDFSPITWGGKFATGVYALIGCAFFALPAGILGSGFAIQVARQKSQQYMIKIRNPAANLIQTTWRVYATKRGKPRFQATWDSLLPLITGNVHWPGYYSCLPGIKSICNSKEFHAYDVDLNLDIKSVTQMLSGDAFNAISNTPSALGNFISTKTRKRSSARALASGTRRAKQDNSIRKDSKKVAKYKAAIQFILRIKYWTCVQNFRREKSLFVELKDIHEKNASRHLEMIAFLREVRETTTNLRVQLASMKVALNERIIEAPVDVKRRRTDLNDQGVISKSLDQSSDRYRDQKPKEVTRNSRIAMERIIKL